MTDETVGIWLNGIAERWSAEALDANFAPHLSELTACSAPDLSPMPDYYVAFTAVQALHQPGAFANAGHIRVLIANFLRRSVIANGEYRDACHAIRQYLSLLSESTATSIHAVAVARFEGCLLQASAAQACHLAISRIIPGAPATYVEDDGSPYDRLNKLGNRIRHYHEDVLAAVQRRNPGPLPLAPIWLTNDGLMARKNTRSYGLTFQELAAILRDAHEAARMLVQLSKLGHDDGDGNDSGALTRIYDDADPKLLHERPSRPGSL